MRYPTHLFRGGEIICDGGPRGKFTREKKPTLTRGCHIPALLSPTACTSCRESSSTQQTSIDTSQTARASYVIRSKLYVQNNSVYQKYVSNLCKNLIKDKFSNQFVVSMRPCMAKRYGFLIISSGLYNLVEPDFSNPHHAHHGPVIF